GMALPVAIGFGIPLYVFGLYASRRLGYLLNAELGAALANSVLTGAATAILTVLLGLLLIQAARVVRSGAMALLARFATLGYALPGTIIGLGLLFALARFDNTLDSFMRAQFGVSTGLLLTGSAGAVVIACTIRFLALADGSVRSGLVKLPP